ncbi:hypothetical protein ASF78_12770 [Cellulomonas sp. Leaf334]|nr:hypothetical protein ASF78_12770 [Cellulomonas sp. Leaf334]
MAADGSSGASIDNLNYVYTSSTGQYSLQEECSDTESVVLVDAAWDEPYAGQQYGLHATDIARAATFTLQGRVQQDVFVTPGGRFVPVEPRRAFDTRNDPGGPLGPAQSRRFALEGVPADATAVVLNLTATQGSAQTSFVSVVHDDESGDPGTPTTSVLNTERGRDVANLVTVGIAPARVTGHTLPEVTLYNNAGTTHLVADLAGYYTPSSDAGYVELDPVRAFDSRSSTPVGERERRRVPLGAIAPAGAVAAMVTVTTTRASAGTSYVSAYPAGAQDGPSTSLVNAYRGDDIANLSIVPLGDGQDIELYNNAGRTDVIVDVTGWFVEGQGSMYFPLDAKRVPDQIRPTIFPSQSFILYPETFGLSSSAEAVMLNVTTFSATRPTYLKVWGYDQEEPATSATNARPGSNVAAAAVAGSWIVDVYNSGDTYGVIDVTGFFADR